MRIKAIIFFLLISAGLCAAGQSRNARSGSARNKASLSGRVTTLSEGRVVPMDFATVILQPAGVYTTTDKDGCYALEDLDEGTYEILIQFIGYQTIDSTLFIKGRQTRDFVLKESNFRLEEVQVIARASKAGEATASMISRQAIDHAQTSSLKEIMQLLPGVEVSNPNLSSTQTLSIRTADATAMNTLGTAVIVDGAPLSNNANMEGITSAITGTSTSIASTGTASVGSIPNAGVDVRQISTDNIESVEVIRGIPSVQYGDLTSGAVIINSKAGIEPLTLRLMTDPKIIQLYASKGLRIGNAGDFHFSADYAHSNAKTYEAYVHFRRANFKTMWTKTWGAFRSNISADIRYGKDTRDLNPDDASSHLATGGMNIGYRLTAGGTWTINRGWLKSLRYDLSHGFTYKQSYHDQLCSNANSIYSTNLTPGTTVGNIPGGHIYDDQGNEITAWNAGQEGDYAIMMPYSYDSHYDFYAKELNTYGKVNLNLFKAWGELSEKILLGVDFKSDGNLGDGLVFPKDTPPYRSSNAESGYRSRPLWDIPFVNQLGIFAESSFKARFWEREFHLTAGVRFDWINGKTAWSPRVNASYELWPKVLTLRGGYGLTAKAPTVAYLYPNNAYYDQVNINNTLAAHPDHRYVMATTYVLNNENPGLQIARNRKAEIGLDLKIAGRYTLGITVYDELMKNGYQNRACLESIYWLPYKFYKQNGTDTAGNPVFSLAEEGHRFFMTYMPLNTGYAHNYGVEWELNLGRFEAIRTSFFLNGAWMHTVNSSEAYSFSLRSRGGTNANSDYAVYAPRMTTSHYEKALTTLRVTHNIPSIGFVITLTAQYSIYTRSWTQYDHDLIPQWGISRHDGKLYPFTQAMASDPEYNYMVEQRSPIRGNVERHRGYVLLNFNLSKEIRRFMVASFYVNNLFNTRPLDPSELSPGSFTELGTPIHFGFEIKFKLK